jgi:hypothetical protein
MEGPVKAVAWTVGLMVFGWALVSSADARHEAIPAEVAFQVMTVRVQPEEAEEVETPLADALVDWVQVDADTDCLWELLQRWQVELTFENVWAAGVWTDALGGACQMIGEDDE